MIQYESHKLSVDTYNKVLRIRIKVFWCTQFFRLRLNCLFNEKRTIQLFEGRKLKIMACRIYYKHLLKAWRKDDSDY